MGGGTSNRRMFKVLKAVYTQSRDQICVERANQIPVKYSKRAFDVLNILRFEVSLLTGHRRQKISTLLGFSDQKYIVLMEIKVQRLASFR